MLQPLVVYKLLVVTSSIPRSFICVVAGADSELQDNEYFGYLLVFEM